MNATRANILTITVQIFALPDLSEAVFIGEDLRNLPPTLTSAPMSRRGGAVVESLAEVLVADLGRSDVSRPFLFVSHLRCASHEHN